MRPNITEMKTLTGHLDFTNRKNNLHMRLKMKRKAFASCQRFFPLIYYENSIIAFKFKLIKQWWMVLY